MLYLIKCYKQSNMDLLKGSYYQTASGEEVEFLHLCPNPAFIRVINLADPKRKPRSMDYCQINKLISTPLPLQVGDCVIDLDKQEGEIISVTENSITIRKSDKISSHNFELSAMPKIKTLSKKSNPLTRGGKREGAGRKSSGQPLKKRKALQLDEDIAAKLPDLKMFAQLLDEFRPIAESGTLRSQKLTEFYKRLDSLPTIV